MNLDRYHGPVLALFRIVVGLMFLCHGVASLFGVLGGNQGTAQAVEFASCPGWWAALIQLVRGALGLLGLHDRPRAVRAPGFMAYADSVVHPPHARLPFHSGRALAAMSCGAFFLLAVLGRGAGALDHFLLPRSRGTQHRL